MGRKCHHSLAICSSKKLNHIGYLPKKSRTIRQSASDLAKIWKLCSIFPPPKLMRRRTTPRVSMGNWFAAFSCLRAGSNFKECFNLRESLLKQDSTTKLAPLSHIASIMRSKIFIWTNTLRWSTAEFNVSICGPGGVSLSARWTSGVDVLSLNCWECYFGTHCGSVQSFHT